MKRPLRILKATTSEKNAAAMRLKQPLSHVQAVSFKNERFIVAVVDLKRTCIKQERENVEALIKLDKFLSSMGKNKLSFFNSRLENSNVRANMRASVTSLNSNYQKRRYVLRTTTDGHATLDADLASYSQLKDHLEYIWNTTPSGRKAAFRNRQREEQDYIETIVIRGTNVQAKRQGGVYLEPNRFLIAHQYKMARVLETSKKPMTAEHHYGIELEFVMKKNKEQNIKTAFLASEFKNYFSLGRDGSVTSDSDHFGAELRICVPHSKMRECISFVSQVLISNGSKVDKSCGLHVHLDARNFAPQIIFNNLIAQQAALFALVPKSRRDNQYCNHTTKRDYMQGTRYKSINSQSFSKYTTIEVRLHSGSIDADKIINWCVLLSTIAYNDSDEAISGSRTVKTMLEKFNFSDEFKAFFMARAEKFSNHGRVNEVNANDNEDYSNEENDDDAA